MRRGVGYVPQLNDVFAPLTVEENLQAGGYTLRKSEVSGSVQRVIDIFRLWGRCALALQDG